MHKTVFSFFALVIGLSACGGEVIESGAGGSTTTATGSTTGSATASTSGPVSCGGLDFCACSHTDGCKIVYGDCICGCDYQCAGEPECACICGGGPYFGCAPETCPGPFTFQGTDTVTFDADGCPVVSP